MARVGVFYSTRTGNTERVARLLKRQLGAAHVDLHDIHSADPAEVRSYDLLVLGTPTWDAQEMPEEWSQFLDGLEPDSLEGRRVALFGLGNSVHYPVHFVDAMGALAERVEALGARIVGTWPETGVRCYRSLALRGGRYVGLPLDEDNEPDLVYHWVRQWAVQLLAEVA
jgi:flavodoxin I